MITELILTGLFGIADILLGLLPTIEWTVDTSAWECARDILDMVCYLLPMTHIKAAINFIIALTIFRIWVSFMRLLMSFIPGI